MMAMAFDGALAAAAAQGNLELSQFMPLIADCLLGEVDLLRNACDMLRTNCITGITANEAGCRRQIENGTAAATALVGTLGYERATTLIGRARETGTTIRRTAIEMGLLTSAQFDALISPESVTRLGSPAKERV
jgi:aspartate ammonia-lyase